MIVEHGNVDSGEHAKFMGGKFRASGVLGLTNNHNIAGLDLPVCVNLWRGQHEVAVEADIIEPCYSAQQADCVDALLKVL